MRVSSEDATNGHYAQNAIDGRPGTWWRTQPGPGAPPHELVIDLGVDRTVRGYVYLPRQDDDWDGAVREVHFGVGDTADQFRIIVWAMLAKTRKPQAIFGSTAKGRYVLFRCLSVHGGGIGEGAAVAELGILGE